MQFPRSAKCQIRSLSCIARPLRRRSRLALSSPSLVAMVRIENLLSNPDCRLSEHLATGTHFFANSALSLPKSRSWARGWRVWRGWRSEKASTVSTLSTFSTSTPSTPGGLLPKIQRLTVPRVWLGPCHYPMRSEKAVFKLGSPFAAT